MVRALLVPVTPLLTSALECRFCPCHGSHYDICKSRPSTFRAVLLSCLRLAGRIRKGPAPVSNISPFHTSRLLTLSADEPRGSRSRLRRSEWLARHWLIDVASVECSLQRIMECLVIMTMGKALRM